LKFTLLIVFLALVSTASYATAVSVSTTSSAAKAGELTYIYFESANAATGAAPTVNTALSQPAGTGSFTLSRGSTDRLWSSQFASARSVSAGQWVFDIWALGASKGTLTISIYITNSAGTVQTTIANAVSTPSIATTKTQAAFSVSGVVATVPASGYIEVSITAPSGASNPTSFTVYWGKAQGTDLQVPMTVLAA